MSTRPLVAIARQVTLPGHVGTTRRMSGAPPPPSVVLCSSVRAAATRSAMGTPGGMSFATLRRRVIIPRCPTEWRHYRLNQQVRC